MPYVPADRHMSSSQPGGQILLKHEDLPSPTVPLYRIVITGGPCSGKSTCLTYFRKKLEKMGYRVFCVPEVATMMMTAGVRLWMSPEEAKAEEEMMAARTRLDHMKTDYLHSAAHPPHVNETESLGAIPSVSLDTKRKGNAEDDESSYFRDLTQRRILQTMLVQEDTFYELARGLREPAVLLMDRGTLDGSAYCSKQDWTQILKSTHFSEEELVEARYDGVIHFVTAAEGTDFYTRDNNGTRYESKEEAIGQDMLTRKAWKSFPFIHMIDNSTEFEAKLERAFQQLRLLLPPKPTTRYTIASLDRVLREAADSPEGREAVSAIAHTGAPFYASLTGPTPANVGVQRFIVANGLDWSKLEEMQYAVSRKRISSYFITPPMEANEELCVEVLYRVIGCMGERRPLYLRRALRRSGEEAAEGEENQEGCVPRSFEASLRIKEEEFMRRLESGTPSFPRVEKEVFRFIHGMSHLTVLRYLAPEPMFGKIVIVGPATMTLQHLPSWILVSQEAYANSWVSRELVM